MSPARRLGLALGALLGLYLAFMLLGGFALRGCVEDRFEQRLARSLDAVVEVGSTSVNVLSGEIVLEGVTARRDHGGTMQLEIERIRLDLPGWGGMLFDHDLERCLVDSLDLTISARALLAVTRSARPPSHIETLELRHAHVAVMPTAILPALGRLEFAIPHAVSHDIQLSHGLSWLTGLRELRGTAVAPGGVAITVEFVQGELALGGSFLGSSPVRFPFKMPTVDPDAYEIDHLVAIAREVLRSGGKVLLGRQVRDKIVEGVWSLLD